MIVKVLKDTIAFLLAITLVVSDSCTPKQNAQTEVAFDGFIASNVFKDHLKHYDDKESMTYSERRFFNLINEESFLDCIHYDFYIVYLYKASQDSVFNIYVVRSKDGITVSSVKGFNQKFPFYFIKKGDAEPTKRFSTTVSTKIIENAEALEIKTTLDKAKKDVKDRFPKYDLPARIVYYFDGYDYHGLSDFKISTEAMDEIDKLFRNSNLFK